MISIIVACDNKGGIAKNKTIPWLNEEWSKYDLKRFRDITSNSVIIMGRNTYNEIVELRPIKEDILPNRKSYILTRNPSNVCKGAITIDSIQKVIELEHDKNIFIIGGTSLFSESIKYCDRLLLTYIDKDYLCDDYFPISKEDIVNNGFKIIHEEQYNAIVRFIEYAKQ